MRSIAKHLALRVEEDSTASSRCRIISPVDHQLSQQLWSLPLVDLLHLSGQVQVIRQLRSCDRICLP